MKIRRRIGTTAESSGAAMSDIAFLLIIFFTAASAFVLKDGLHLILPDKSRKPLIVRESEIIVLRCSQPDSVYVDGIKSGREDLDSRLKTRMEKDGDRPVLLRVAPAIPYDILVYLIDAVRQAGFTRISLRMESTG